MQVMVVGCGSIGRRHLLNLMALGVDDVIACDPNENIRTASEALGICSYSNYHEAIAENPNVTAAVICTPTSLHVEQACDLACRGIHLLIEKPLSHDVEGIAALLRQVNDHHLIGMMAMCYRFHPALMAIKKLLEENCIGRVYSVRIAGGQYLPDWHPDADYREEYAARASMGGGVLLTNLVHSLDVVRWMFGECAEVQFLVKTVGDLEIDTDDIAVGHLSLESGVVVQMYADFLQRNPQYRLEVIGQTGTIYWEYGDHAVLLYADGDWQSIPCPFDPNQMYMDEMRAFVTSCEQSVQSPVPLLEGARDMLVLEAMRQSSVERRCIRVPEFAAPESAERLQQVGVSSERTEGSPKQRHYEAVG